MAISKSRCQPQRFIKCARKPSTFAPRRATSSSHPAQHQVPRPPCQLPGSTGAMASRKPRWKPSVENLVAARRCAAAAIFSRSLCSISSTCGVSPPGGGVRHRQHTRQ